MIPGLLELIDWNKISKIIINAIINAFIKTISVFSEKVVCDLLFDGEIRDGHRTTYVLNEINERYKDSITSINYALSLNVGFAFVALYAYLILPPTELVEIPFIGLSVSKQIWISLVPTISYALQILIFVTFIWFMLLRLSLKILVKQRGVEDDFGDVTNVVLNGPISYIWIVYRIGKFFDSRWNYLWYLPTIALVAAVVISPLLICLYFIVELFSMGSFWLALIYGIIFVPFSAMFLLFIVTSVILGLGEWALETEAKEKEYIEKRNELDKLKSDIELIKKIDEPMKNENKNEN